MQLAAGVFKHDADGAIGAVLLENGIHHGLGVVLVRGADAAHVLVDDAHADNLVAVVDQLVEQPLQRIVGVGVLVDADHEGARAALGLVAAVADIERQGRRVALGRFAEG